MQESFDLPQGEGKENWKVESIYLKKQKSRQKKNGWTERAERGDKLDQVEARQRTSNGERAGVNAVGR